MTASGLDTPKQPGRLDITRLVPSPRAEPTTPNISAKMVLVASTGGHLAQLVRLSEKFGLADDSLWVTFDSPQSRSLLKGRRTLFVPYVKPRDWKGMVKAGVLVHRHIGIEKFDSAISTGAAVAVGVFAALALRSIPLTYIESVSRVNGPSLTGRIFAASRIVRLHTQHRNWQSKRWTYKHSVLDAFEVSTTASPIDPQKILVSLGTIQPYRFDAAVDAVARTGMASDSTRWQLGVTSRDNLPGTVHDLVPAADFARYALEADVVVTHAGVGTILQLLDLGICPVVLIRRSARGEHIDDHQQEIARLLREHRLAVVCEADELGPEHLIEAANKYVSTSAAARSALRMDIA